MVRKIIPMLLVVFLIFAISHSAVYASHIESAQAAESMAITSATVTFDLKKKDTLILKGTTGSLSLTGATSVIFEAGPFKQEIALDKFKKSNKKYTFTAAAGKAGLGSLILDMAKGKFSAKVRKLLLVGFTNPLPVSLTAGTSAECSMIQFGVNKNKWTFSESKNPQYGCLISQTPQATPKGLFVNKAKDVTVQVQVPSHPDLNQNTIGLFRVDSNLNILSGPHCGLLDNGSLLNGDQTAGDRIFSCLANLQETTAGKMFLMVGAELGGKMTYSPSFSLDVVVPYTEQEAQQTVASHQQAGETWQDNLTRYGDTKKARKETVKTIKAMEGVKDAGVSSDGVNIWIEFTSGIRGGLILSQEEGPSGTARPFVEGKERAVMKMTASPLSVQPASCKQESDTAGGTSSAGTVGNCKVLIWDFWPRKPDDVDSSAFESNPNQIFQINKEYGESCTVDSLRGITKYGTVIIRTSGQKGRVGPIYLTDEPATLQKLNEEKYMLDFLTGCLEAWIDMDQEWKFYFTPSFISTLEGQFNQSIVYVEAQHSSELASAFLRKGAYTFFGYSTGDILHYHWMLDTRNKLFTSMVKDGMDTGEAYAALSKTSEEDSLFLKYSSSTNEISYDCETKPASGSITLQVKGLFEYTWPDQSKELLPWDNVLMSMPDVGTFGEMTGNSLYQSWDYVSGSGKRFWGDLEIVLDDDLQSATKVTYLRGLLNRTDGPHEQVTVKLYGLSDVKRTEKTDYSLRFYVTGPDTCDCISPFFPPRFYGRRVWYENYDLEFDLKDYYCDDESFLNIEIVHY